MSPAGHTVRSLLAILERAADVMERARLQSDAALQERVVALVSGLRDAEAGIEILGRGGPADGGDDDDHATAVERAHAEAVRSLWRLRSEAVEILIPLKDASGGWRIATLLGCAADDLEDVARDLDRIGPQLSYGGPL